MDIISLTDPRALDLRYWLTHNCKLAAKYGCDDRLLSAYLARAENDSDGLIEIKARESVTGQTVTYQVQL